MGGDTETPQKDTAYTLAGLKADLLDPRDYPAEAVCIEHGRPIRCDGFLGSGWVHFEREDAAG